MKSKDEELIQTLNTKIAHLTARLERANDDIDALQEPSIEPYDEE